MTAHVYPDPHATLPAHVAADLVRRMLGASPTPRLSFAREACHDPVHAIRVILALLGALEAAAFMPSTPAQPGALSAILGAGLVAILPRVSTS